MRATWAVPVLLLLAACASARGDRTATDEPAEPPADLPFQTGAGDEMLVSCWGQEPGWPVSAMAGGAAGLVSEDDRDEIGAALTAYAAETLIGGADGSWIPLASGRYDADDYGGLLEEDADRLVVGVGTWTADGPGEDGQTVDLAVTGDGYRPMSGGDCTRLTPTPRRGHAWVELSSPAALSSDPLAYEVGVMELGCTSARDPLPHVNEPVFVETEASITVYLTTVPPEGDQECPGNPVARHRIDLPADLAGRALLDGSTWPPTVLVEPTS